MTRSLRLLLGVLLVVGLAAPPAAGAAPAPAPAPAPTPTLVRLYFTAGEQFSVVSRTIQTYRTKALPTVNALLRGPTADERARHVATQIPAGVTTQSLTIDGTAAVIELSPSFLDGIPADPAARTRAQAIALNARLGQVIYTLTQFPPITSAKVLAAGQLLGVAPPAATTSATPAPLARRNFARPAVGPRPEVHPAGAALSGTREVQQRLAALGFLSADAVDGLAGYRTQQAILAFQAWHGLGRDGVAGPLTQQELQRAGRPQPHGGAGLAAHRIEVYRALGVALLVDGGRAVRAIHVSAGGPGTPTPAGRYRIFRKELRSWSVPFSTWLPFASYFNDGIAFHEYADVPPFPASHGCVRVPAPEAPGVYAFAGPGTTVLVL